MPGAGMEVIMLVALGCGMTGIGGGATWVGVVGGVGFGSSRSKSKLISSIASVRMSFTFGSDVYKRLPHQLMNRIDKTIFVLN